jgi:membrane-associated phospholipid phosphatase
MRLARTLVVAAALVGFATLALGLKVGGLRGMDLAAARIAAGLRTPAGVAVASGLSDLATPIVVAAVIAAALLWRRRRGDVLPLVGASLGAFLSGSILKLLIHRARPAAAAVALPRDFAFPSGHATAAAALYITLALVLTRGQPAGRRAGWLMLAVTVALAVAGSRVYLGVHYLSDVLAGLLWGTAWSLLAASERTDGGSEVGHRVSGHASDG